MQSLHAARFNHDEWADGYDADVQRGDDPVRAGYAKVLAWVSDRARIRPGDRVLELGSGTGNLTGLLPRCAELVCVDLSRRMEAFAAPKTAGLAHRRFVQADLLEFFERPSPSFDRVVSTYAVHHLTADEKSSLFHAVWAALAPGGRAVFGDLMVRDADAKAACVRRYEARGDLDTVTALEEEFFWPVEESVRELAALGFQVETECLSDLSWGLLAEKPDGATVYVPP